MFITGIRLRQFRNYQDFTLSDLGNIVIFTGPNAIGKTNIIEAINLLTATSSFRHPQISQLIMHGADHAQIQIDMSDSNRLITTSLTLEPGKKRFQVNGKTKPASEVKGVLPAVTFVPDDLEIAKKSSSVKRMTLDELGVQLSKNYDVVHRDYEKTLRYKNRLLKDESPQPLIEAINETLVAVGSQLYCYRRSLFERILPIVQENYEAISQSKERFDAEYIPSWLHMQSRFGGLKSFDLESASTLDRSQVKEHLYAALQAFGQEEIRAHRAFVGPHNDQITFYLSQNDASSFASQGQQRSIVLAWKLAEVQMVRIMLHTDPVLLLDDVMSELDESRRNLLVQTAGTDVQTFITATDLSPFNPQLLEKAHVISL